MLLRARGIAFTLWLLAAAILCGGCADDRAHRAMLDEMVRKGASEAELVSALDSGATVYARGEANWQELEAFLQRERADRLVRLREATKTYPRIVYSTTAWRMTWVFVDEQRVVRGYLLAAQ